MQNNIKEYTSEESQDISAKDVLKNIGEELEELQGNSLRIQAILGEVLSDNSNLPAERLTDFQALDKMTQCLENLALIMRFLSDESNNHWQFNRSSISTILTLEELQARLLNEEYSESENQDECDFF